jgi:metal-responsive CopG/Arc/MetJ family transcriptional regulator
MPTEKPILTFAVDKELLDRINDFRFENRIETRSEAIRILVEKGLKGFKKKTNK